MEGSRLSWMVAVIGGDVGSSGIAELAISHGGHVRVGLEDYAGSRQPTNEELITEVADLSARAGRRLASTDETASVALGA
jgi:uncharacterized protein (DUF849 family)